MSNNKLKKVGQLLIDKKLTIAFAESATGGRVASEFSLLEKAGKFLKGGFVCYDASLKEEVLGVPKQLIKEFTPESEQVTAAIAKGLGKLIKADIHIGITGLASPGGSETEKKPVGTIFIHALLKNELLFSKSIVFKGSPEQIVTQTVAEIGKMLLLSL